MSKFNEVCESIGVCLLFFYLLYIAFFFLGGKYENEKIECIKNHEFVEARYNIITGCWYWDDNVHKMVKSKNNDIYENKTLKTTQQPKASNPDTEALLKKYGFKVEEE